MNRHVLGIDFGSDSVRAVVIDAETGRNAGTGVAEYPRWKAGKYCDPARSVFRQHPADFIESMERCVIAALRAAGSDAARAVVALAVDATGSTPAPVDADGTPLALLPEFSENPNAMFFMWKDHSAIEQARIINEAFSRFPDEDYTRFQGVYSSEWYWAKILYAAQTDPSVRAAAHSWVEHSDWIPALLTGRTVPEAMYRNACSGGHKALWHSQFGGLPARALLESIDPCLAKVRDSFGGPPQPSMAVAGVLSPEWARRLGLSEGVLVGGSSLDAHAGAVGAGIRPGTLVKVIGTSTVDMLIAERDALRGKDLRDVCGQAEDSIVPGYVGIESGQAAFGDVFSWFRRILMWSAEDVLRCADFLPSDERDALVKRYSDGLLSRLEAQAAALEDEADLLALDWFNGRRYPKIDERVRGALTGLNLGVSAAQLYRALVLSAVFASRRIFDGFVSKGLNIDEVIAVGGIAKKSPMVMQMMADVLRRPIHVCESDQSCARGAAIYAAVAAGIYRDVIEAGAHMAGRRMAAYLPNAGQSAKYETLYQKYIRAGQLEEQLRQACREIDRAAAR
ncbi:MAG: ribulokinase [Clostridia bacterium]|nr:ribulokinase [Clostridia bacterium]